MNAKMMSAAVAVLATMIGAGCAADSSSDEGQSRDALCKLNTSDVEAFRKCLTDGIPKVPDVKLPEVPKAPPPSTPPAPPAPPVDVDQDADEPQVPDTKPADPGGGGTSSSAHQCTGKVGGPLTCICTDGAKKGQSCSSSAACDTECRQ